MERIHVPIRLLLMIALGAVGCSSLYWLLYLVLPALAALEVSRLDGDRYIAGDGPKIGRALEVISGAYAYLWFLTDDMTLARPVASVECRGAPTPGSALMRCLTSLPALIVLMVLSALSAILWPVAALSVLLFARVPSVLRTLFAAMLRYQLGLLAYHLSLVDEYPTTHEDSGSSALASPA